MFCNDLREKYEEKIILKGVDAETMNILLDYTYTSKMLITKQNVQKVLEAASLFQVQITQMHGFSLVALATPCLTLAHTLQTALISWVLQAFCLILTYIVVLRVVMLGQCSIRFRSACKGWSPSRPKELVHCGWHGWPEQEDDLVSPSITLRWRLTSQS